MLAGLEPPTIVRSGDIGTSKEDGLAYLFMEYVDAGALATNIRSAGGPRPLTREVEDG